MEIGTFERDIVVNPPIVGPTMTVTGEAPPSDFNWWPLIIAAAVLAAVWYLSKDDDEEEGEGFSDRPFA